MFKKTVVLFEKGFAPRVFINPDNINDLKKKGKVLINPKIPRGVPPHEWLYTPNGIKSRHGVLGKNGEVAEFVDARKWYEKIDFRYLILVNFVFIILIENKGIVFNFKRVIDFLLKYF